MKVGTVGTHLHIVRAKITVDTGKKCADERPITIEEGAAIRAEKQALIRRGMRAAQRWPQERNVRVEALRSLVQSGHYRIDSKAIAECLLNNETHFV
jgi:anti-sigma28 factor (negative regulator of flagellin synthesis)